MRAWTAISPRALARVIDGYPVKNLARRREDRKKYQVELQERPGPQTNQYLMRVL
jgi:hypothetical protein